VRERGLLADRDIIVSVFLQKTVILRCRGEILVEDAGARRVI
jgi:hypothetical protein